LGVGREKGDVVFMPFPTGEGERGGSLKKKKKEEVLCAKGSRGKELRVLILIFLEDGSIPSF